MTRLAACLFVLVASLAACSDGGDSDEVDATAAETPEATGTPEASVSPEASASPEAAVTPGAEDDEDEDAATTVEPSPTGTASATATVPPDVDMDSPAFTEASAISTVGIDEVFFGMFADEAAEAASTAWEADPEENPDCWFATPVNGPDGVRLMIWESTVERVDVQTTLITTRSGAGVGSTADELRELFGEQLSEQDPTRLVFVPADEEDADFRIVFDMIDGVVVAYRAGRLPMVEFEGCG